MKKTAAVLLTFIFIFISFAFVIARAEGTDTDGFDGTEEIVDTEDAAETEEETDGVTEEETETDTETEPESDTEPPHVHDLIFIEDKAATCTQPGAIRHYECLSCGKLYLDDRGLYEIEDENAVIIKPYGHKWGEWETVLEPGAVTPGVERRICDNKPKEDVVLKITLDAGHGMYDNKGVIEGYYEGRMSFALMSYLKAELEKYSGVVVCTTRQKLEDEPPLPERGKMAAENGSNMFISIHSNWFSNPTACGVSVYRSYFRPESEELGRRLGLAVTKVINDVTGITYMRNDGNTMTRIEDAYDSTCGDGVLQDYYNVTRASVKSNKCRYSYIIEHGFHSNPEECRFLMDDENLQKLAYAEARVIATYFGLHIREDGVINGRHAEYREIPPAGSDEFPYVYNVPEGYSADASAALPGGATVNITELDPVELPAIPYKSVISAFELGTKIFLWDIEPGGKITVSVPYRSGEDIVGAAFINGDSAERVNVNGDEDAVSVAAKKSGTYVLFTYGEDDVAANDMNGDGSADNKDVVTLFRSVSGADVFIEKLNADTNEDGEVSNKDVVMLFRILSETAQAE